MLFLFQKFVVIFYVNISRLLLLMFLYYIKYDLLVSKILLSKIHSKEVIFLSTNNFGFFVKF